jgi:hypothetical protein
LVDETGPLDCVGRRVVDPHSVGRLDLAAQNIRADRAKRR